MIYAIRPLSRILIAAGFLLLASVISCEPDEPTAPAVTGISLGKGGPPPKVDEADPPSAPQDITLDVRVLGSGFDDGSVATWTIDGVPQPEVRTNSTRFVSSKELVANITIDAGAPVDLYDIEVVTTRGKKGIGGDLFAVLKKGTASFSLTELEPSAGNDRALAEGMNESGQIVGSSWGRNGGLNEPTLWTVTETNGGLSATVTALEFPPTWFFGAPQAITNSGVAVGTFQYDGESTTAAARWDVDQNQASPLPLTGARGKAEDASFFDGGFIIAVGQQDTDGIYWENELGPYTLPPVSPGAVTSAKAVNSSGIIAGDSDLTAVIWVRVNGSYAQPCELETNSFVYGMSEVTASGHVYVAGGWDVSVGENGAVWKVDPLTCIQDGAPRHLDFLSRLNDVSDAGDAVGEDVQKHHAILWTDDGQLIELPGLKKGGSGSLRAMAITPDGKRIVGASAVPKGRGSTGVLWLRF